MSAHPHPRLTPKEYLEIERAAAFKSEYYNGHMYAMSGGSYPHGRIIGNLAGLLYAGLRDTPCGVVPNDLRVRVSPSGLYTYPDIVVCGEPRFTDDRNDTLINPTFVAEVLSPTTEAYDRGFKATQYRTIESLQEYALVSQSEPRVEVYRRQADGWLLTEASGLEAACHLGSVGCRIALADVYEKIAFAAEAQAPTPTP